jgi:ABC-type Fe3+/spermidine/putrescine transport system ATPase subunit
MQNGEAACCMVRPENLRLSGAGENKISALVEDIVFLGESEQYLLRAGKDSFKALAVGSTDGVVKGKPVQACFTAEDTLLLPQEGGNNA